MRLAAHGHTRREKPRLFKAGEPLGGVRTGTPQCDAANPSMTLAGILPDSITVQYKEATAIFYELDTVRMGTRTLQLCAGLPHLARP
jgi:hypothetical protein